MTEPNVVVLAQNASLLSALRAMLGRHGFSVSAGRCAALGTATAQPSDGVVAVLVDVRLLHDATGTDLRTLRSTFPGALLLAMAGRRDHPALLAALQDGALPLTADFHLQSLVDTLRGGDGSAGVREPRRPHQPSGAAGAALTRDRP